MFTGDTYRSWAWHGDLRQGMLVALLELIRTWREGVMVMRGRGFILLLAIVGLVSAAGWATLALVDAGASMTGAAEQFLGSLSESQRAPGDDAVR